jgi:PKD repeat protein
MSKRIRSLSCRMNIILVAVTCLTVAAITTTITHFSAVEASNPPTSNITVPTSVGQTVSVTWTGEIPALVNGTSDCANLADTLAVDQHLPTINVPSGIYSKLNAKFTFNISWDGDAGNDEILTVIKPDGTELDSSDGGDPTETVTANNLTAGTYKVIACGFISGPAPQSYVGKLTIDTNSGPPAPPPTPTPTPAFPGGPRYYNYAPPAAIGEAAGEPSIGYNLTTHHAMYIAGLQTLRVTFPENIQPKGSMPEACEATWEDVSTPLTHTKSLDPILFTDQNTGRTFVSQLNSVVPPASPVLIGLNSLMAYTDDDGATWTPAQINPPDGSYDHQTVGAGPYPASVPLGNAVNKGDAVYYCAQAGVTAFCSRSDDGGLNFGRAMPAYTSVDPVGTPCGGIHGHVKVAPDGTVYLPDRGCDGVQAVAVSTDAGTTWTVKQVQGPGFTASPPPGILDPSVGIASDGTLYFSYINGDGHAHVAVSHDRGDTWINDFDIGASQNIGNAVFVEAVAGNPDRAAVGFLGTTQTGNHEDADFNGTWYVFIAHTYDGGLTWTTVNATPNDPVQREACIWNEGGNNPCRNLLDFNEITMDEKGRVLYAYADGCIGDCASGGPNSYSSKATIARQSGGKGLLSAFDSAEPVAPQRACLSGRRDDMASYLRWVAPDNGGSDITAYKIYRGTSPGNEILIGQQVGGKTTYNDRSVDPGVSTYTYKIKAVNAAVAEGAASNIVSLTVGPRVTATGSCSQPGNTVITDPVGDETDTVPQHDITSISMAEPIDNATTGAASNLVFTIKVVNLANVPPGWRWSVRFGLPGYGPPASPLLGPQEDWFVSMISSDGAAPTFTYGTTGVFQGAARFFTTVGNLDPGSNFNADGTITLILPKETLRSHAVCSGTCGPLNPGQVINLTLGSVRFSPPSELPGSGGTNETIPDTTGAGTYVLRADNLCLPNTEPVAVLSANTDEGIAPLTVTFDGSGSYDVDSIDTIATYTFNFGDGGDDVNQTSPTISHTFDQTGEYIVRLVVTDSRGKVSSNTAQFVIEAEAEPPPTPTPVPPQCIEDNDSQIAYSGGWHLINISSASGGHFRYHTGNSAQHFASLDFSVPAGNTGSITYSFAKSPKGGTADVYLDGVLRQTINYAGTSGSTQAPEFKPEYKVQFGSLAAGAHKLELKNLNGVVYLDRICLESSSSNSQPSTGPGSTSNQTGSAAAGQTSSSNYQPQSGSKEISVSAESSLNVPFKVVLVDPSGLTLQTANSVAGIATVSQPVTKGGVYVIKVVNLSLGPLQFTVTTTPTVQR